MVIRLKFRFNDNKAPVAIAGEFRMENMDSGPGAWIKKVTGVQILPAAGTSLKMGARTYEGRT